MTQSPWPSKNRRHDALRAQVEAHQQAQQWAQCMDAAIDLVRTEAHRHFALESLATSLMQLGRTEDALDVVKQLCFLSPRDPFHRLRLATMLQVQGEHGASLREFERVALMFPDQPFTDDAREAVENLDRLQTSQIFLMAAEQLPFRWLLERNPAQALEENGFYLSENGLDSLKQMIPGYEEDAAPELPNTPKMH